MPDLYSLLLATNYQGTQNQLNGCLNDWKRMLARAAKLGIPDENIISLIGKNYRAELVSEAVNHLISVMQSGDKLFGANSSHGTQVPDKGGDEADHYDEALVDNDLNLIIDDEIYKRLCMFPEGSLIVACFDNCHAGTMDRDFNAPDWHYMQSGVKANAVAYFGCAESGTSADAYILRDYAGAVTYCYDKALVDFDQKLTYLQLLEATNLNLRKMGFKQVAKMACTRGMENKMFWTM